MRSVVGWGHMMNQSVLIQTPTTSVSFYGGQEYTTGTTYRCRLSGKRSLVLNDKGQQVLSRHTVYLMTNDIVHPASKITLSTGDIGSTEAWAISPPILAVGRYPDDGGGFHHTTIYLG